MPDSTFLTLPPRLLPELGNQLLGQWLEEGAAVPRVVITPSAAVGRNLLQAVAQSRGLASCLHMVTLPDLARGMAAPLLDAWIMPPHADRVITAHLLAEDAGPYGDHALRLPLAAALARTVRDLREAGIERLPAEEILGELGAFDRFRFDHLGRIFRRYAQHLKRKRLADDAVLYRSAREGMLPGGAEQMLVYGIYDLTGVQRELLAEISSRVPVTWLCPTVPEESPSAAILADLKEWAEVRGFQIRDLSLENQPGCEPDALMSPVSDSRILACPGESAEAREVVRDLLLAAESGMAFGEMAVLMADPLHQEPLLRKALAKARVPVSGRPKRRLLDRPYGRALMAVIRLAQGQGGRAEVAAVLRARFEAQENPPLEPSSIARILRQAGCGRLDPALWRERLGRLAKGLERGRARRAAAPDSGEAVLSPEEVADRQLEDPARVMALADAAVALIRSLETFQKALTPSGDKKRWADISHDLIGLISQLGLRAASGGALFAAAETAARLLTGWDKLGISPRGDLVLELWLDRLLEEQQEPDQQEEMAGIESRRGGEGVLLLDWNQARGLAARAVWLTGLSHESFAPPGTPDPILGDTLRSRLAGHYGCQLRTAADRFRERDLLFAIGLAAGRERVTLSWPRVDDGRGQLRLPVEPLARLIEERSGSTLDTADPASCPEVDRRPTTPPGIEPSPERPLLDLAEYDLASARDPGAASSAHLEANTALARCRRADRYRLRERTYNQYTGITGGLPREGRAYSATGLEEIARCPFRFFLREGLELKVFDETAELAAPEPRELGSVAHRVLMDLFRSLEEGRPPEEEAVVSVLARIDRWLDLRVKEVLGQGALGTAALWRAEAGRMRSYLERYVLEELRAMRDEGRRVVQTETPVEEQLSLADVTLTIRGRPDRVDRLDDGSETIVDYKWSKGVGYPKPEKGELFKGGRHLQLPLYAALLDSQIPTPQKPTQDDSDQKPTQDDSAQKPTQDDSDLDPQELTQDDSGPRVSQFRYVPLKAETAGKELAVSREDLDARSGELKELIGKLVGLVERGELLPVPRGGLECKFCDYRRVCGPRQAWIEERKQDDPRFLVHQALERDHP